MKIQGKGALVSGGASGLGAATVRMLAGAGARVLIADINDQLGTKLAQELGSSVAFFKTDITQEDQVKKLVEEAVRHTGGLHIVVNTAGIGVGEKVLGKNGPHDLKKFTRVIQVNLIGTFDVLRQASQPMAANAPDE
ncbi:MAG TPA: SDR family NAD(P)-dependent oxidoreductase, partial [Candidatus Angelobacter sp.]|nr:SDR family NAD(P)-dependent oxidoreductase [Candidatus Angelobacter sp.]